MSPVIAPSTTVGALRPSLRNAATNVVVFQWPCGTGHNRRSHLELRPFLRVMLVLAQFSSTNTSFAVSSHPTKSATPGVSPSRPAGPAPPPGGLFFDGQAKSGDRSPQRGQGDGQAQLLA